jgi:site-specific DNA-adenine methylase
MGSKQNIAETLINEMRKYKPKATYFYDLFGGGGSMSFAALKMGYNVVYNEYNPAIANLLSFTLNNDSLKTYGRYPDEWYSFIDRTKFKDMIGDVSAYGGMVQVCYSFGNMGKTYLYRQDLEVMKHYAHDVIVYEDKGALAKLNTLLDIDIILPNDDTINGRRLNYRRQMGKIYNTLARGEREVFQQIQHLLNIQQLERLNGVMTVYNKDYYDVIIPHSDDEVIIYCDPPYNNTGEYQCGGFDAGRFYDWLDKNEFSIFMSEYESKLYELYSIDKRVTFAQDNRKRRMERLFCNRPLTKGINRLFSF